MVVGAAGWPLSIRAQQPAQAPLIGVLFNARADDPVSKWFTTAFARLMKERGPLSSPNVEIQYRFSGGDTDATRADARELIGLRPAVILASSNTSMARAFLLYFSTLAIPLEWDMWKVCRARAAALLASRHLFHRWAASGCPFEGTRAFNRRRGRHL